MFNCGGKKGGFTSKSIAVSRLFVRWKSRERQSAMTLVIPGMCCEYSHAPNSIIVRAFSLAISLCIALVSGSKFDLWSHPTVQLESLMLRTQGEFVLSRGRFIFVFITLAINSFRLREKVSLSVFVNSYRQANPVSRL